MCDLTLHEGSSHLSCLDKVILSHVPFGFDENTSLYYAITCQHMSLQMSIALKETSDEVTTFDCIS